MSSKVRGVADIDDSTGIGRERKKNPLPQQALSGTRLLEGWAKGRLLATGALWDCRIVSLWMKDACWCTMAPYHAAPKSQSFHFSFSPWTVNVHVLNACVL
jgi:hypothetical protein